MNNKENKELTTSFNKWFVEEGIFKISGEAYYETLEIIKNINCEKEETDNEN